MYITRIQLNHIRGFRKLDLRICDEKDKPRMRTAIIGMNGTCKTTLLRCLAMGLCGIGDANALLSEPNGRLITNGRNSATIKIDLAVPGNTRKPLTFTTTLKVQKGKEKEIVDSQTPIIPDTLFVVGYGIGRSHIGSEPIFRPYRIVDSAYSLFNYETQLITPELTLRRLQDYLGSNRYEITMRAIKSALALPKDVEIDFPKGGGVEVFDRLIGEKIPLEGWADGYRLTFSWILDLYAWAMRAKVVTKSGGIKGILLIDELEQHFHPSMQTSILLRLKELWPEMQVFGTTHSPLVTLGASPDDIVVLQREGKYVNNSEPVPNFSGFSVEDVLSNEDLFNTEVYEPETNKKLAEYKKLAKKPRGKLTSGEKGRLKVLANELRTQQLLLFEENPLITELQKLRKDMGLKN